MNINLEKVKETMIENQLRPNKINDNEILNIIKNVPKENFISDSNFNICYSDQDISVKDTRGYLKNLHLAQILYHANIRSNEKILHIGGLTGYLSVMISKLCKEVYVTDNDAECVDNIIQNFINHKVINGYVFKMEFSEGLITKSPFDVIIIDCPLYKINLELLKQLKNDGRIIYIEKINDKLSKAFNITKIRNSYCKDFLFDVFSNFCLMKKEESFNF